MALIGLALFLSGCGDGSSAMHPRSCTSLGDPERSCSFEGRWSTSLQQTAAEVTVGALNEIGSFRMEVGPLGETPWYLFWAPAGATQTAFSGDVQFVVVGGDLPFEANVQVDLLDGGFALRLLVVSGELLRPNTTFEGTYVSQ